jgi:5-methylcytosine-specific restriction endonuclease McrA
MTDQKPIEVYNKEGHYLSHCSRKRAAKMVYRKKARWIGRDQVELLVTSDDEKAIRKEVRKRDGDICYICECSISPDEITYDHVTPRDQGGEESVENISVCCRPCNEDKANLNLEEYGVLLYNRIYWMIGGFLWDR